MPQTVTALAQRLSWNARLFDRLIEGYGPEDWWQEVGGMHACWLVGHITIRRRQAMSMIGLSVPNAVRLWERCFRRDAEPAATSRQVVPDEVVEAFHAFDRTLSSHWARLTAADLLAPLERPFPDGGRTLGAGLRYVAWNETFYLGQLSLVRRVLGKPIVAV